MENFIFKNTTTIIFGRGTIDQVGVEARRYGKKVLLVYGEGFVKRTGILDRVRASLLDAPNDSAALKGIAGNDSPDDLTIIEFPGTMPNPTLDHVNKGIALCKENNIDFILALGGGSVIDVAKAIGVGALYDGDVWDFFDQRAFAKRTIPVGVILTVPGTGSEASNSSVITNNATLIKRGLTDDLIRPVFAIMDPTLAYSLSSYQTACGAADAMSHVMERYFCATQGVDCTDRLCEALLKSLIVNGPMAIAEPDNYNVRAEILLASKFAHDNTVGVGRTGDFSTHKLGHQLSVHYDMTHGASVALMFLAWMRYVYKQDLDRFVKYAVRVWDVPDSLGDAEAIVKEAMALEGIKRTEDFFKSMGLPIRLSEAGIPSDKFEEMAEKATSVTGGIIGNFMKLTTADVLEIYKIAES